MPAARKTQLTVDQYIMQFPLDVRAILQRIRRTVRAAAPRATELISYQMPAYKLDGRFLVSFAAWTSHIALYPIPQGTAAFQREVALYRGAKSSLRLPLDQPIPYDLVKRLVAFRVKEERRHTGH